MTAPVMLAGFGDTGFGDTGWNPELETERRDAEARALAADPFLPFRRRWPKFARLDFRTEAERIRGKRSAWSASERATILRAVEAVDNFEAARVLAEQAAEAQTRRIES